jgi:hypothetical protein
MPNLPSGANVSNVATDLLDAADKHVPTLGLNARRKFFHALAVAMFIPGVASDVSLPCKFRLASFLTHSSRPLPTCHSALHSHYSFLPSISATLRYTHLERQSTFL